jgi:hypothetical protein
MPPPTDREALVALLAEQARSDASPSGAAASEPEPEELLDYLAGRLPPEEAQRIERLLVASPEAARALLDLAELEAAGRMVEERPAELAAVAGWRELQSRLPGARPSPPRLPPWLSTIAASLLLVTVGGLGWKVRSQEEELARPVANSESFELAVARAGRDPSQELLPGTPLRLLISPARRCSLYTVRLEGLKSGDVQTIKGLRPDKGGRLTPLWPRGLEPGSYNLRILGSGCEPGQDKPDERSFQITRGHEASQSD